MSADLSLVAGLVLAGLAVLNFLARFVDGRPPRLAAVLAVLALGLVAYAEWRRPEGYTIAGIPMAVVRVVGSLTR